MAHSFGNHPQEWEIEGLQVEVKTAPFALPLDDELHYEIQQDILERCKDIMRTWKVKADYISGNGDDSKNKEACKAWSQALTDRFQIPIEVKCIYYSPMYSSLENKIVFGLNMTEDLFQRYKDKHKAELSSLINDLFGE